jgi:hypothetical protein
MKRPTTREDMAGRRKLDLSAEAQEARVLAYLQANNEGLNRYEAERLLGVCQLAPRIFGLKERGHTFLRTLETATDPHGIAHHGIARYFLTHEAANDAEGAR